MQRDILERRREDRMRMAELQLRGRDIKNKKVLAAMERVPREEFIPDDMKRFAYEDNPLPIGEDQTISQPYIVALMTQLLDIRKKDRVLEIGTGSGYQAAVLAELAKEVYSVEIIEGLAVKARAAVDRLGYRNVHIKVDDGYFGWADKAPFDAIMLTAATPKIPKELLDQLKEGGHLVAPLGEAGSWCQSLIFGNKHDGKLNTSAVIGVRFVPMTGEIERI